MSLGTGTERLGSIRQAKESIITRERFRVLREESTAATTLNIPVVAFHWINKGKYIIKGYTGQNMSLLLIGW